MLIAIKKVAFVLQMSNNHLLSVKEHSGKIWDTQAPNKFICKSKIYLGDVEVFLFFFSPSVYILS